MARAILFVCLLFLAAGLWGCVNAHVTIPDYSSYMSAPPPATIPKADPSSKADLLRENQQLRDRTAYLEREIASGQKKSAKLDGEARDVQAKIQKVEAERDRYKGLR